jgi:hypothetical protein
VYLSLPQHHSQATLIATPFHSSPSSELSVTAYLCTFPNSHQFLATVISFHVMERAPLPTLMLSASHLPIWTLPSKILLIISKFTYVTEHCLMSGPAHITANCNNSACWAQDICFYYHLPGKYNWDTKKYSPTAQFPNFLASACFYWGKVMLLIPAY